MIRRGGSVIREFPSPEGSEIRLRNSKAVSSLELFAIGLPCRNGENLFLDSSLFIIVTVALHFGQLVARLPYMFGAFCQSEPI